MIFKEDIKKFEDSHRILLQVEEYICVLPHPELSEYISNYNITFPTKELMPNSFTVMPCGCSTIAIKKDKDEMYIELHGPVTKPYTVGKQSNQLDIMVTIEFKPAGLYALTKISQSELADENLSLAAIDPIISRLLIEAIEDANSIHEIVTNLDDLLLSNMNPKYHPELKRILKIIKECNGDITVKEISESSYYSERQLNRIFKQYVGISAKAYLRLLRINNTFRLLKKPDNSLTNISATAGFHDLPHFTHDFKLVCGITPQEYRDNISNFYYNISKY